MAEGNSGANGAPAAQGIIRPLNEAPPAQRVSALDLADAAFDKITAERGAKKPGKPAAQPPAQAQQTPPAKPKVPEPEFIRPPPGEEDDEDAGEPGEEGEPAQPDVAAEGEETPEPAPADKWGTAEEPYALQDIPEDKFVRVKVDGEWQVLPLREALDGGIRLQTFTKRVAQAQSATQQAKALQAEFHSRIQMVGESLKTLIGDPQELYGYLLENAPESLDRAAKLYAVHKMRCEREPGYEAKSVQERYEARIRKQQEQQERHRHATEQQRIAQEARARAEAELRPGYEAGLKEAGFPKVNDEFKRMVRVMLQMHEQETGRITADDMKAAVVKVAAYLKLPKASENKPRKFALQKPNGELAPAPADGKTKRKRNGRSEAPTFYGRGVDSLLSGMKQ